jgi:hypothetical protein
VTFIVELPKESDSRSFIVELEKEVKSQHTMNFWAWEIFWLDGPTDLLLLTWQFLPALFFNFFDLHTQLALPFLLFSIQWKWTFSVVSILHDRHSWNALFL